MRLAYINRHLLLGVTSLLLTVYVLFTYSKSHAKNGQEKAIVTKIGNGILQWTDKKTKGLNPFKEKEITLEARRKGLVVPKALSSSSEGMTMANIVFKDEVGKSVPKPIAHVRSTSYNAIYWFPCRAIAGKFIFAWIDVGNENTGVPVCSQIDMGTGRIDLNTQLDRTQNNYASKMHKGIFKAKDSLFPHYTQNPAPSSRILIFPQKSGTTIVYTDVNDENITVNALVGNVTIQFPKQSSSFILQQGHSYNSSNGSINDINDSDIPRSSVDAFLNPNNWSQSVTNQIQELQQEPCLTQWRNSETNPQTPRRSQSVTNQIQELQQEPCLTQWRNSETNPQTPRKMPPR
jgi:hypothetical protein